MEKKDAVKKFEKVKKLIKEHSMLYTLMKHMELMKREHELDWDIIYMDHICKRMLNIEKEFDNILK